MAWFKWRLRFRNRHAGALCRIRDLDARTPMDEYCRRPARRTVGVGSTGIDHLLEGTGSELPLCMAVARRRRGGARWTMERGFTCRTSDKLGRDDCGNGTHRAHDLHS